MKRMYSVGNYLVKEEKKSMVCIYLDYGLGQEGRGAKLLTSRGNWNSAVKLARLLNETYEMGYNDARDIYSMPY